MCDIERNVTVTVKMLSATKRNFLFTNTDFPTNLLFPEINRRTEQKNISMLELLRDVITVRICFLYLYIRSIIITARVAKREKVMFSQVLVCSQQGCDIRGGCDNLGV